MKPAPFFKLAIVRAKAGKSAAKKFFKKVLIFFESLKCGIFLKLDFRRFVKSFFKQI